MSNLEDDTQYGAKKETIVDSIGIGENVAIPCDNDVGKVLWLLFCDKAKQIMKDNFFIPMGTHTMKVMKLFKVAIMIYFALGTKLIFSMMMLIHLFTFDVCIKVWNASYFTQC
jgi:hypothetical protein